MRPGVEVYMAKKSKKGVLGTIIFILLLGAVVAGFYMMVTRDKEGKLEADVEVSDYSMLMRNDLSKQYPQTVREVVKYFCRIIKCANNEELSDDQMEKLVDMLRILYSDELLEQNPREAMLRYIRGDISAFKEDGRSISTYGIDDTNDIVVEKKTKPAKATVHMYFTVKNDKEGLKRYYWDVLLYESSENVWKILGWRENNEGSGGSDE